MDIFTTQLTRVRQVPIKPSKLRVKSLAKEAKTRTLDEEKDHLDEHELNTATQQYAENYFRENAEEQDSSDSDLEHKLSQSAGEAAKASVNEDRSDKTGADDDKNDHPHLDIFV